jgi:hypothetical protein
MRQTVAVGIIKSVEKTDKTGGKGEFCSSFIDPIMFSNGFLQ